MSQTLATQVWTALSEVSRLHAAGKHHGQAPSTCKAPHSRAQLALSIFLCVGIVVSYLPQIYRIISLKTSAGFSPWFLLLGATSSASVFLNVLSLQWGVVLCCTRISAGQCAESLLGLVQVGLQWLLFNTILALFLVYFPKDRRYERAISLPDDDESDSDEGSSLESGEEYSEEDDSGIRAPNSNGDGSNVTVQEGHLAVPSANTATRKGPGASGLSLASDELSDDEEEEDDPSSSAFTGLVPTFWPVWKAPARGGPGSGSARYPNVGGRGAPARPASTAAQGGAPWLRKLVGVRNMSRGEGANAQAAPSGAPATSPVVASDVGESGAATPSVPGNGKAKSVQIQVPSASDSGVTTVQPGAGGESGFSAIVAHASAAFGFGEQRRRRRVKRKTAEWSTAMGVGWATGIHFVFTLLITLLLVSTLPPAAFPSPSEPPSLPLPGPIPPIGGGADFEVMGTSSRRLLNRWAAFLGGTATLLATAQYLPQIWFTARAGLVGSLSISMMCLQVPGSILFIYSLSLRPGVNITSLAAYICTGILQGVLLLLCIAFKVRQRRAGIDDFGNTLPGSKAALLQEQQQQRQPVSEPSPLATVAE